MVEDSKEVTGDGKVTGDVNSKVTPDSKVPGPCPKSPAVGGSCKPNLPPAAAGAPHPLLGEQSWRGRHWVKLDPEHTSSPRAPSSWPRPSTAHGLIGASLLPVFVPQSHSTDAGSLCSTC